MVETALQKHQFIRIFKMVIDDFSFYNQYMHLNSIFPRFPGTLPLLMTHNVLCELSIHSINFIIGISRVNQSVESNGFHFLISGDEKAIKLFSQNGTKINELLFHAARDGKTKKNYINCSHV